MGRTYAAAARSLAVLIVVAGIAVAPLIAVLQTHSGRSSASAIGSAVIAFAVLALFALLLASGLGRRAPVELAVNERELKVHIRGMDRVWALHGGFVVPLAHVVSVDAAADEAARGPRGLRMPGTGLPGFIVAGTYIGAQTSSGTCMIRAEPLRSPCAPSGLRGSSSRSTIRAPRSPRFAPGSPAHRVTRGRAPNGVRPCTI